MVIDHHSRAWDHQKASLNGHHDCQYLDITRTFTNFNQLFLKQSLSYFERANQIYNKSIVQAIRTNEMNSNNLMS